MLKNLTNIPRVMRGKGWLNGARLLDLWFSRTRAVAPGYSAPDTTTITMAWVLRFPRARAVYDQLLRDRIWANAPRRRASPACYAGRACWAPAPPPSDPTWPPTSASWTRTTSTFAPPPRP